MSAVISRVVIKCRKDNREDQTVSLFFQLRLDKIFFIRPHQKKTSEEKTSYPRNEKISEVAKQFHAPLVFLCKFTFAQKRRYRVTSILFRERFKIAHRNLCFENKQANTQENKKNTNNNKKDKVNFNRAARSNGVIHLLSIRVRVNASMHLRVPYGTRL